MHEPLLAADTVSVHKQIRIINNNGGCVINLFHLVTEEITHFHTLFV